MGKLLLVTGTDTGVGKTVAAAWLAKVLASHAKVALVKAVQTGTDPLVDGDEAHYKSLTNNPAIATYTIASFPEPLAPSIAARRAGKKLAPSKIVQACRTIAKDCDITIVEGAGGLLVPIAKGFDFADLAKSLKASLVVVIRPGLGTLNHTILTVEAAERRGLHIDTLVCNGLSPKRTVVEVENLRFLRERYPKLPIVVLHKATPRQLAKLELRAQYLGRLSVTLKQAGIRKFQTS